MSNEKFNNIAIWTRSWTFFVLWVLADFGNFSVVKKSSKYYTRSSRLTTYTRQFAVYCFNCECETFDNEINDVIIYFSIRFSKWKWKFRLYIKYRPLNSFVQITKKTVHFMRVRRRIMMSHNEVSNCSHMKQNKLFHFDWMLIFFLTRQLESLILDSTSSSGNIGSNNNNDQDLS